MCMSTLAGRPQHPLLDIDGKVEKWSHFVGHVDEEEATLTTVYRMTDTQILSV